MTGRARYVKADREQPRWDLVDLNSQLPSDHRARVVWAFVESLDLGALYGAIRALEGGAGRPPIDPAILLALWLYATLEGVGSARQLERLCGRDAAYRWLCGGASVNYHGLSDFRVEHGAVLDRLLTDSVSALALEGLVSLEEMAVDGTKIQASAGRGSFRRGERLAAIEEAADKRVAALKAELGADPAASECRRRAAQQRAAEDVAKRAQKARATLETLDEARRARAKTHKADEAKKKEPRASTTDPQARRMRFPDGAIRAGYNVQLAALTDSGIVVGAEVTDRRNDAGLARPMMDQVHRRYHCRPKRLLVDTHYATQADIEALATPGLDGSVVEVYSPLPPDKPDATPESQRKRAAKRKRQSEAIIAWRTRMSDPESQTVYRRRSRIETINALFKARTLRVMLVRSIEKVRCVVLLNVLAHNLWRAHTLRNLRAAA